MSEDSGFRPYGFTEKWGYQTEVSVQPGEDGQPKKVVSLIFGEHRGFTFSEIGWRNMSPAEARELAWELEDAAQQAEELAQSKPALSND